MKTYTVINHETNQAEGDTAYAIGDVVEQRNGTAVLTMRGIRPGSTETHPSTTAALEKVRGEYGWWNAYLEGVKNV